MGETETLPQTVDELVQLSREVETLNTQLNALQTTLARTDVAIPSDVLQGMRQLNARLITLQEAVGILEQEVGGLRVLAEIGYIVNSSLDPENVLSKVMDTIIKLSGAQRAFLMLQDAQGELYTAFGRNWKLESLKPGEYEISRTVIDRVVERGEALLTTNAQEDPRFDGIQSVVAYSLRSILCVPLKVKDDIIGVIYAENRIREGIFTEAHRFLLSAFADQAAVALENAKLFNDLSLSYHETLESLARALDAREKETEQHTRRVELYSMALAKTMGLSDEELIEIRRGTLMHDIGKIGVPDAILQKPGPLTEEEWVHMRRHPEIGLSILQGILFFKGAIDIVGSHHEHYDGGGYPRGLVGDQIPLGARIFTVADALDAITSDRVYRKAQPFKAAYEEIMRCRGTQFDPKVVDAFRSIDEEQWMALRALTTRIDQTPKPKK
ncbi:MAG TPA: HD domain-containing protein [Anaerolineae bacterium]|nr:HD domain-containing protein [Anaerolineae bacterium]